MDLFHRSAAPILTPRADVPWASGAVFNPGAVLDDAGRLRLLVRGVAEGYRKVHTDGDDPYEPDFGYDAYVSTLGLALRGSDGAFQLDAQPLLSPGGDVDRFGCEDARITRLDGTYYITYTALSRPAATAGDGVGIALATTTDWQTLTRHGRIGPAVRDKDAALFPARVSGRIAMFHRIAPDVQIVYFEDEEQLFAPGAAFWEHHFRHLDDHVVLRPEQTWEAKKVGMGPPPVETPEGWLVVYHAADAHHTYRAGLALLDLDDPRRVIARTRHAVLEPALDWEREGDVPNVVFPQGAVVEGDALHLYYGAADSAIGHAQAPLADVMALLDEERTRWRLPAVHFDFQGHRDRRRTLGETGVVPVQRLHGGQPVLEPIPAHDWESRVVLNPAAVLVDAPDELDALMEAWALPEDDRRTLRDAGGACVMLYRAQGHAYDRPTPDGGTHYASALGLAVFTPDLRLVRRWAQPVIAPEAPFHDLGVEDARCTRVGDTYYLHYTGYTSADRANPAFLGRVHLCLATTTDFLTWTLHGPIAGDVNAHDDKNGALFPEPARGRWWLWHRPIFGPHAMSMHLAEAESPDGPWRSHGSVAASFRFQGQALSWVGAAGPPLALGDGRFLSLYHQGHLSFEGRRLYNLAALLVEPGAEAPVLARAEPLLLPEGDLECVGDPLLGVDNVVFSCANYLVGDRLVVPYAGADSRIFGAEVSLRALVERLEAEVPVPATVAAPD